MGLAEPIDTKEDFAERLESAYRKASASLLAERVDGHWVGQLSTSALSTATAVSALSAFRNDNFGATRDSGASDTNGASQERRVTEAIDAGVNWLADNQNEDGGWGDTQQSYSNISTTLLGIAALHFSGVEKQYKEPIERAQAYVDQMGGIPGLKARYGIDKTFAVPILANCAMAGIVDWKEVSALPFEAACVPQRFYHWMQLPVVSYAIPALVAIGQAKYFFDPPWNPFSRVARWLSISRSLRVLQRMQPQSGGFLEAIPLTSFVTMALCSTGRSHHPVAQNGLRFIFDSVLDDGSWPIDTNLATWTTTLSVNALTHDLKSTESLDPNTKPNRQPTAEPGTHVDDANQDCLNDECLEWILGCQTKTVHPFTNSPAGGWGWTDLSGAVPDADDTPGALLALAKFYQSDRTTPAQKKAIEAAAVNGVTWLLKLQNRDLGWPTFCRGWGKLPFDRSGSDITAHCLRGLNQWKDLADPSRIESAITKGLEYLDKTQLEDGSWLPLWFGNQEQPDDINPIYGTAKVLTAYSELGMIDQDSPQAGLSWIANHQNDDGSWGGGVSGPPFKDSAGKLIRSGSIEETSLAVESLMLHPGSDYSGQIKSGLLWLIQKVESDQSSSAWPIGFYFAKLWYFEKLYPQIFVTSALGRACLESERFR